jgi:hypothetical protein
MYILLLLTCHLSAIYSVVDDFVLVYSETATFFDYNPPIFVLLLASFFILSQCVWGCFLFVGFLRFFFWQTGKQFSETFYCTLCILQFNIYHIYFMCIYNRNSTSRAYVHHTLVIRLYITEDYFIFCSCLKYLHNEKVGLRVHSMERKNFRNCVYVVWCTRTRSWLYCSI